MLPLVINERWELFLIWSGQIQLDHTNNIRNNVPNGADMMDPRELGVLAHSGGAVARMVTAPRMILCVEGWIPSNFIIVPRIVQRS